HPVVENYLAAFKRVRSVTYRVVSDADHALSQEEWRQAYGKLLLLWITEMTMGARGQNGPGSTRPASPSRA
ncbi:MAG: alpha/beta hydrolase, partial [Variovorax sp.]